MRGGDRYGFRLISVSDPCAIHARGVEWRASLPRALKALPAGEDPIRAVAREHLLATTARGYDALDDAGLAGRVAALTA